MAYADPAPTQREAQRLADAGETEQALQALDLILGERPADPAALLLRARVLLDSRNWGDALATYERYLEVAPRGAKRRSAEQIVANLEPARTTFVEITVPGDGGAKVYLDSKSSGVFCDAAPTCKRNVLPGDHRLIIERDGFERDTSKITFAAGQVVVVERVLVEKSSPVTIGSVPAGATITVDGKVVGTAPQTVGLPGGSHRIELTLEGYLPTARTVTPRLGAPLTTEITFDRGVRIDAPVAGARFELDGTAVTLIDGTLPVPVDGQPHQVVISAPTFRTATIALPATLPDGYALAGKLLPEAIRLTFAGTMAGTVLSIDGERVGPLPLATPWTGEPGAHTVEIAVDGVAPFTQASTFEDDQLVDVQVARGQHSRWPAFMAGTTLAFVGGGAAFGALALANDGDYADRAAMPGATNADPELRALADDGDRYALFADIAMGAAIVSAGATVYLWLTSRSSRGELRVTITPAGAGLRRTF